MRDCVQMLLFAFCSVRGMGKAFPAIPLHRRQGITDVLLGYLRKSASVINAPGRADDVKCATWLHGLEIVKKMC